MQGTALFQWLEGGFVYVSGLLGKEDPAGPTIVSEYGSIGVRGTEFVAKRNVRTGSAEIYLISGTLDFRPKRRRATTSVAAPVVVTFNATTMRTARRTSRIRPCRRDP